MRLDQLSSYDCLCCTLLSGGALAGAAEAPFCRRLSWTLQRIRAEEDYQDGAAESWPVWHLEASSEDRRCSWASSKGFSLAWGTSRVRRELWILTMC